MLFLTESAEPLVALTAEIPFGYAMLDGSQLERDVHTGAFIKLSPKGAEVRLSHLVPPMSNIKIQLVDATGAQLTGALYAKIIGAVAGSEREFSVRFTSMSPEIKAALLGVRPKTA